MKSFINERIARLGQELRLTDDSISEIKQQGGLTNLTDGARSIVQADRYGSELTEAQAQGMMLDYLGEYVSKPENKYEIIPSNMGMHNSVSEKMIGRYNEIVQKRKRLLQSASEESPQVKTLTAEADEMSAAILAALQQAKHSSATEQERLVSQYSSFRGRSKADVCNQIVPSGTDRNLDLLQAGPIPPNPTELLARESFGQVMAILKK